MIPPNISYKKFFYHIILSYHIKQLLIKKKLGSRLPDFLLFSISSCLKQALMLVFRQLRSGSVVKPNCYKCRHFKVTWNKNWPYACQAFNFKSQQIPWRAVVRASGLPCQMFMPKSPKKKKD